MLASTSSSQPGMFPIVSINSPISLAHTLPPPGSSTVSAQQITLPTTSVTFITDISETSIQQEDLQQENEKKIHICSLCHKGFMSRYNLTRHEKSCKLSCKIDDESQQALAIIGKLPACPHCNKEFTSQQGVTRHLKRCKLSLIPYPHTTRSPASRKVHLCRYCGKQFSTKWNAIRHENLFHTTDEPIITESVTAVMPYIPQQAGKPERFCRFCGNYFSTKYNAIRHERICTRLKNGDVSNVNSILQQPTSISNNQQVQQSMTVTQDNNSINANNVAKNTVLQVMSSNINDIQDLQNHQVQAQQQVNVQQQQATQLQVAQQSAPVVLQQQQNVQQHQNVQQQNVQQQTIQHQQILQQNHQLQNIVHSQVQHQALQGHQQILQTQPQQIHLQSIHPQHTVVCGSLNQGQPIQLNTQQLVFVSPFHVCKYCGKQFDSKCESTLLQESLQSGHLPTTLNTQTAQAIITTPTNVPIMTFQTHQPGIQQFQPQQIQQQVQPQQQQQQQQQQVEQQQQQQNVNVTQIQENVTVNTEQQKPHGCRYCTKHFATKWYLDQHEKLHTGQAVICKACNKSFVTRWHMEKHMRVHNNTALKKSKKDDRETTIVNISGEIPQTTQQQYVQSSDFTHFTLNTTGNQPAVTQIQGSALNGSSTQSAIQPQQTIVTVPLSFADGAQFVTISSPNSDQNDK